MPCSTPHLPIGIPLVLQQKCLYQSKDVAGFNIGLSTKFKLPATPIFLMPEIYYTNFKSKVTYVDYDNRDIFEISAKSQRIDIPILAGIDIIGPVSIFAGTCIILLTFQTIKIPEILKSTDPENYL